MQNNGEYIMDVFQAIENILSTPFKIDFEKRKEKIKKEKELVEKQMKDYTPNKKEVGMKQFNI